MQKSIFTMVGYCCNFSMTLSYLCPINGKPNFGSVALCIVPRETMSTLSSGSTRDKPKVISRLDGSIQSVNNFRYFMVILIQNTPDLWPISQPWGQGGGINCESMYQEEINVNLTIFWSTVNFWYLMIIFTQNTHNRCPIACPHGQAMGHVLWVQNLTYVLHIVIVILNTIWSCDIGLCYIESRQCFVALRMRLGAFLGGYLWVAW